MTAGKMEEADREEKNLEAILPQADSVETERSFCEGEMLSENQDHNTQEKNDDETMFIDPEEDALNAAETLRDMAVGLVVCAVAAALIGCIFIKVKYRWVLGVLLGAAVAAVILRHLYVSIDRALDMDEEHASKYMKKSAVLRILIAGAGIAAGALLPEIFHVFGVFFGILCLKFTAYLQPLTHKAIKILSKGR